MNPVTDNKKPGGGGYEKRYEVNRGQVDRPGPDY